MTKLTEEAEAEIKRLYDGGKWDTEQDFGQSYVSSEEWKEILRAAMIWAYKDAARVCRAEEEIDETEPCAKAIEALVKNV